MPSSMRTGDVWLSVLLALALLASLALFALGVYVALQQHEFVLLGLGLIAVVVSAAGFALAGRDNSAALAEAMQRQNELLESINNRMLLSDKAKRIAYRRNDRETLRRAIVEDMQQDDYDAAMVLVREMAEAYGYRDEAEQFRERILQAQQQKQEERIRQGLEQVNHLCRQADWEQAQKEALRLRRLFPDHPQIDTLPQRVAEAKENRKSELEREFLQAAEREDVEHAMDLLKEMDRYLTPEEAAPFVETARGVVGKKRENLGVRFKMAVQDRNWLEALSVGETIVREFPNSKFAHEVRGMIDTLRERAAQQRAATAEEG